MLVSAPLRDVVVLSAEQVGLLDLRQLLQLGARLAIKPGRQFTNDLGQAHLLRVLARDGVCRVGPLNLFLVALDATLERLDVASLGKLAHRAQLWDGHARLARHQALCLAALGDVCGRHATISATATFPGRLLLGGAAIQRIALGLPASLFFLLAPALFLPVLLHGGLHHVAAHGRAGIRNALADPAPDESAHAGTSSCSPPSMAMRLNSSGSTWSMACWSCVVFMPCSPR